jgi:hypothetical protein
MSPKNCGLKKKFACPPLEKGYPGEPPFFPTTFRGKTETLVGRGGSDVMADDDSGSVRVAPSALSRFKTNKEACNLTHMEGSTNSAGEGGGGILDW